MSTEINGVALYMRTATKDKGALDMQRAQLLEYVAELEADANNLIITEYTDVGLSGLDTNRPGLNKLLTYAQTGRFDLVVSTDSMRINRNSTVVKAIAAELDNLGAVLDFANSTNLLSEAGIDDGMESNDVINNK